MQKKVALSLFTGFLFFFSALAQKPNADFSANVTTGCGSAVVKFTDLSTNTPTSWLWNFGNGVTAVNKNPTISYASPGTYTVTLTATNASGGDTEIKNGYINIFSPPAADFGGSPLSGCTPHTVNFQDSSLAGSGAVVTYLWDFGDGATSTSKSPAHTYNGAGSYQVSLSVTDTNSCSNKKIKSAYVQVTSTPVVTFSSNPTSACAAPLTVNFNSSTAGSNLSYKWDFGDGGTDSVKSPAHTYNTNGSFTVSLIVTSATGCSDTLIKTNNINISSPVAGFTTDKVSGCAPVSISFTDTSAGTSRTWYFGDGTSSTAKTPTHPYNAPGVYDVSLVIKNGAGCRDSITLPAYITAYAKPAVAFAADDTSACQVPFAVNFTDNTPAAASWSWTFGDGGTSTLQAPGHTYNAAGSYTVSLVVVDTNGCSGTLSKPKYINLIKPAAGFTAPVKKGCKPLDVAFTDTSFSNEAITSWLWTFGDGSTSTSQNPLHTYTDTGVYTVKLVMQNIDGCADSVTRNAYIEVGIPPIVNFAVDDTLGCHPLSVLFTDSSSSYTNEWKWDFGDGGTSALQHPPHTYSDTGYFDVTLIAGNHGCYDTLVKPQYIHVLPPKPIMSVDKPIGCTFPHAVQFTDQSKGAETWEWTFGDGATSTQQHPAHTYTDPGFYTVKLLVTNSNGCRDSITTASYVRVSDIDSGFTQSAAIGCQPFVVSFNDTSKANTSIANWLWDFGDGYTLNSGGASGATSVPGGTHGGNTSGTYKGPSHTYQVADTITVKLIVTDALGCKDSISSTNVIVKGLPVTGFTADKITGCAPLVVTFADTTTPVAPATLASWQWTFGDGATATDQNPSPHTYNTKGTYTVTLSVTDSEGCTKSKTTTITPTFPAPAFTFDTLVCSSDAVAFTNSSTGSGLTYLWHFGDGDTSTATAPSHNYFVDTTTVFSIKLIATDVNLCADSVSQNITISKPVAGFGQTATITDCPPFFVSFFDSTSADVTNWLYDFGDGVTASVTSKASADTVSHVYNLPGVYDVSTIITNTDGCKDTVAKPQLIHVGGPILDTMYFSPKTGCSPLTVTFVAKASANTEIYQWVFGDGDEATGDSVVHTYTNAGVFYPVLILSDSLDTGLGDTVRCEMSYIPTDSIVIDGPTVDFSSNADTVCAPLTVSFFDLTTPTTGITKWQWDFGDGTTSSQQNPSHAYSAPGSYDVSLAVTAAGGCVYTITKPGLIDIFDPPAIQFTLSDTGGCPPLLVAFTIDTATVASPVTSWLWSFGDGATSTVQDPAHAFVTTGTFTPGVTATFANGCVLPFASSSSVFVNTAPTADFQFTSVVDGFQISAFNFLNTSTGAVTYLWNFGDGVTSTATNPSHTYASEGVYPIQLIAYDVFGCPDTLIKQDTILKQIKIPNVFTPDGNGVNDVFYLEIPGNMDGFTLLVYNRWGQLVYESDNYKNDWRGTDLKGHKLNTDVYYYILKYKEQVGWNGWVKIIKEGK